MKSEKIHLRKVDFISHVNWDEVNCGQNHTKRNRLRSTLSKAFRGRRNSK